MGKRDDFLRLVQVSVQHFDMSVALERMQLAMRLPEEAFPDDVIAAFTAWRQWQVYQAGDPKHTPPWLLEFEQNQTSKLAAGVPWILQEGPQWGTSDQDAWRFLFRQHMDRSTESIVSEFWGRTISGKALNFSMQMTKGELDLFLTAMRKTDGWIEEFVEYHPAEKDS